MNDVAWEMTHSVDAGVTPTFAWTYMTNVANWDDPPARFELDGPFAAGSRGTTHIPGQESRHWQVREVNPIRSYIFEMPLDRATISFEWRFEARAEGKARLTQHIILRGENAAAYVEQVGPVFSSTLAPGMTRIAAAMERASSGPLP
jgi:hypothetical protein